MMAVPILSLDYVSTNVKGHNDISIESPALPVFIPGRLQSDLFQSSMYPSAHAYLKPCAVLHYVIVYLAGYPATRDVTIFARKSVQFMAAGSC